jgi:hypothetical protein
VVDNLSSGGVKYVDITYIDNIIELTIDSGKYNSTEIYIIVYSYIYNKGIFINKIDLISYEYDCKKYRNITYICYFSYIDFKIWLIQKIFYINKTIDTTIYSSSNNLSIVLRISITSDSFF